MNDRDKNETLGQFEQQVLTAAFLLHGEGYSASIAEKVDELAGKRVYLGAVYVALDRLEKRGFVASRFGDRQKTRGTARKYFTVTPEGQSALAHAKQTAQVFLDALGDLI